MVYRNDKPSFPEFDEIKWISIEKSKGILHEFQYSNIEKCEVFITEKYIMKYLKNF